MPYIYSYQAGYGILPLIDRYLVLVLLECKPISNRALANSERWGEPQF